MLSRWHHRLFFASQNPRFFALMTALLSQQQHWWLTDNLGFNNSVDDWRTALASITVLTIDKVSINLHCSLHYARATGFIKQRTLIILCIQYSWTKFLYMWLHSFLMKLYNKAKHTTISHGCYAVVQFIPATSLVRPTIFGPWVTAIDRFHCTMVTPWHQKEPCVHVTSTMAVSGKRATVHPQLSEPFWSGGCSDNWIAHDTLV